MTELRDGITSLHGIHALQLLSFISHCFFFSSEASLRYVTVHELGHALGIEHSNVKDAVMYAYLKKGSAYPGLNEDDIKAIQSLYGK